MDDDGGEGNGIGDVLGVREVVAAARRQRRRRRRRRQQGGAVNNNVQEENNNNDEDDEDEDDEDFVMEGAGEELHVDMDDDADDQQQEEDEEDDDDDDDVDSDNDDGDDDDDNSVIEGGVAETAEKGTTQRTAASDADIQLFLTFQDPEEDESKKVKDGLSDPFPPPNHPVLKAGVTMQIGMDKSTKLNAVFRRYCTVANELAIKQALKNTPATTRTERAAVAASAYKLDPRELEFLHCQLLSGSETPENAALMKNDRITVRKEQSDARAKEEDFRKKQRESDKAYFETMLRKCLPRLGHLKDDGLGVAALGGDQRVLSSSSMEERWIALNKMNCNSISSCCVLDCRGKIYDDNGRIVQNIAPTTTVPCHIPIVRRRCKWLARKIEKAGRERVEVATKAQQRTAAAVDNDDDEQVVEDMLNSNVIAAETAEAPLKSEDDDDVKRSSTASEEDDDEILQIHPQPLVAGASADGNQGGAAVAAQIENDDDEEEDQPQQQPPIVPAVDETAEEGESSNLLSGLDMAVATTGPLCVVLPEYAPSVVRLLLEYCYTNRVVSLGLDAFMTANKSAKSGQKKPVPPYPSRKWPNHGEPTVLFGAALQLTVLAEEAEMPRLSLMAEVASALLVSLPTVVEALSQCQRQKETTGNPLPILRKACMEIVLSAKGPRSVLRPKAPGVLGLTEFRRALKNRRKYLVPTLLTGTAEVMDALELNPRKRKKSKDIDRGDWQSNAFSRFEDIDKEDAVKREKERRKRRMERWEGGSDRNSGSASSPAADDDHDDETRMSRKKRNSAEMDVDNDDDDDDAFDNDGRKNKKFFILSGSEGWLGAVTQQSLKRMSSSHARSMAARLGSDRTNGSSGRSSNRSSSKAEKSGSRSSSSSSHRHRRSSR